MVIVKAARRRIGISAEGDDIFGGGGAGRGDREIYIGLKKT